MLVRDFPFASQPLETKCFAVPQIHGLAARLLACQMAQAVTECNVISGGDLQIAKLIPKRPVKC